MRARMYIALQVTALGGNAAKHPLEAPSWEVYFDQEKAITHTGLHCKVICVFVNLHEVLCIGVDLQSGATPSF